MKCIGFFNKLESNVVHLLSVYLYFQISYENITHKQLLFKITVSKEFQVSIGC